MSTPLQPRPPAADLSRRAEATWALCASDAHAALEAARAVHRDAERAGDEVARALALRTEGRALQQLGRTEVAARVLRKAAAACAGVGLIEPHVQCLHGMHHVYRQLSDLDAAAEVLEEAAHLAAEAGDERLIAGARVNLSGLRLELGDFEAAAEDGRAVVRVALRFADRRLELCGHGNLGRALVLGGDPARGLESHTRALWLARQLGDVLLEMCALEYSGEALLALGQAAEAVVALRAALDLAHRQAASHDVAGIQRWLALALVEMAALDEAEDLLVAASALDVRPRVQARTMESLSAVRERRGDLPGALSALRSAWHAVAEAERIESADRAIAAMIRFETVQARAAAQRSAADASVLAEAEAALEVAKTRAERALRIDQLTATTTRRHGMELLRRALRGTPEGPRATGLLVIDVDHFKVINDERGHGVGDQVLAETARRIKQSLRLGDVTVRWGGEEFLVLLPTTASLEAVAAVAERVRASVGDRPVVVEGKSCAVTVSIGALLVDAPADLRAVLGAADVALYRAKHGGRDCVVSAVFGLD